jgi:hypothetical protein
MEKINLIPENMFIDAADLGKRTNIIITDKDRIRPSGYDDIQYIKWLNMQYLDEYSDVIPYHYIMTLDGVIYYVKEDFIATKISSFNGYENDIFIYFEGDFTKIADNKKQSMATLCAMLCKKYAFNSESIILFPYDILKDESVSENKSIVKSLTTQILENRNPIDIVENSFINEQKETGNSINKIQFTTLSKSMSIKELSDMTGIPQSILLQQNEYLN